VIKAIRNSLNLADIFETTLNELGRLLNVERVVIVQYRPDLGEWHHLNEYRSSEAVPPMQGFVIPDAENLIAAQLKQGETVKIEQAQNARHLDPFNRELFQTFPGNWLIVPLQFEHYPWGALTVHRLFSTQAWHPNEVSILQVIADQLGVAIRQAELYQSLQAANQELARLAITDDLTQIANRRYFDECLVKEWNRLLRDQAPLSLVFCDVDDFKAYNDLYGHQAGDQCLYLVAQALATTARRSLDIVARYGGEEFALILPYTNAEGARQVVENIRTRLQGLGITHRASRVSSIVTASFGVSTVIPTSELSPISLLEAADQALYQAKENGRNTYCVASPTPKTNYDF
jgi:diguanylate cyclase (GGDEF)-like protein